MKQIALIFCLLAGTPAMAQSNGAVFPGVKGVTQGVFNVRTMYGAIPDGSTDNATAITNAFTATNAFTNGIPTVYFDCDTGTTTCEYNYSGSGISPINPLVGTTILCAPGATLNYTGAAHAVDLGPTTLTHVITDRYTIQGCRWTGGANFTGGIYVNDWIANLLIIENVFWNFGNQTAYSIVFPGSGASGTGGNWTPIVSHNYWQDTDGFTRNMVDAHSSTNTGILFTDNKNECEGSGGTAACSVSTVGAGVWLFTGHVIANEIKYHYPAVRIATCAVGCGGGAGIFIQNNLFEGNSNGASPAVTYGDPGTIGSNTGSQPVIANNYFFWPSVANVSIIGPETASSGSFALFGATVVNNTFGPAPSGTGVYINTNAGNNNYASNNRKTGASLNQTTTPPLFDTGSISSTGATGTLYSMQAVVGFGGALANSLTAFDSSGVNSQRANYHNVAGPLTCSDVTGSGTAQTCNTSPAFIPAGSHILPTTGDTIWYTTTTTNTGDVTLNANSNTAVHIRKWGGAAVLAAGDLQANTWYPLTYDGTFWEMPIYKQNASSTGAGTQTLTNSPCTTLTTAQWVPVQIAGQTGTWFVPACQ